MRGGVAVEQVFVPAGSFMMGSEDGNEDERPVHEVTLDAFWIDRTEVTNEQYSACVADGACRRPASEPGGSYFSNPEFADYPVVYVSWEDAQDFAAWGSGRLPTEAEWEYAARGPESQTYPWGNAFDGDRLNFCDTNCPFEWADNTVDDGYGFTAPVGSYTGGASWVDAFDMAGNVWEWINDWYDSDYYPQSPTKNPTGPVMGDDRTVRGGSYRDTKASSRVALRTVGYSPVNADSHIGFRVVEPFSDPAP
jgi:serine/threonine-protein kinase